MTTILALDAHLREIMVALRISPHEVALATGTTDRTVARWLAGEAYPQSEARRRLAAMDRLRRRLAEDFTSVEGAQAWLHAESGYFGGLRPIDALARGRVDAVEAALEALAAGVFV